jgi:apolipoprotein N-acyltransferase
MTLKGLERISHQKWVHKRRLASLWNGNTHWSAAPHHFWHRVIGPKLCWIMHSHKPVGSNFLTCQPWWVKHIPFIVYDFSMLRSQIWRDLWSHSCYMLLLYLGTCPFRKVFVWVLMCLHRCSSDTLQPPWVHPNVWEERTGLKPIKPH